MGLWSWLRDRWAAYKAWQSKRIGLPRFTATLAGDTLHIESPRKDIKAFDLGTLKKVSVATNDSGPFGYDLWFVLEGGNGEISFPLETDGLNEVLQRLDQLPGFRMRGMNSTANAWFECWPNPQTDPTP